MKYLFTATLVLLISTVAFSQRALLKGMVIDDLTDQEISYANAILKSPSDSTVFMGAISSEKGAFKIENINLGKYSLELSFIGYQSVIINDLLLQKGTRDIGIIKLKMMSENLDEFVIKANKQAISYKIDKKVIDAGSFPSAEVAIDLLENVPSLQIDFEGNLKYRGDGTFKIFINGHPVANGMDKLRQLPASTIDRIEVITNPSAKYDAEGTAGIIQVILKKNRLQGYAISSSVRVSSQGSYFGSFSVDQKGERGGWYVKGYLAKSYWVKAKQIGLQQVFQGGNTYVTQTDLSLKNSGFSNSLEFGFNYDFTKKDYFDLAINFNPLKQNNINNTSGETTEETFHNGQLTEEESYSLNSEKLLTYRYLGATLTYEHSFSDDRSHMLKSYVDFSTYLHPLDEEQIDEKTYVDYVERPGYTGQEHNEILFEMNVSYLNKISEKTSFETGLDMNLDHIPKINSESGNFDEQGNITPFSNYQRNQEVDFVQDVYSAFAMLKSGFNKFEFQMGLRSEYTFRKSNFFYQTVGGEDKTIKEKQTFLNFFPSVHAVYNFTETQQIAFSYSSRINRPNYWTLIPIKQYSNPQMYYTGNSVLKPSYSNAIELSFKKSWDKDFVGIELFSRNTNNVIQNFSRSDTLNILVETPENVGNSWSNGLEVMTGIDVFHWWNVNFSTSAYYYSLAVDVDEISKTQSQFKFESRINTSFQLPQNFTLKFDVNYTSPIVTAQDKRDAYFYSNLAVKKSFFDKKWQLMISYSNIFNSINYNTKSQSTDFTSNQYFTMEPYVSCKLTFNFDNQE